MWNTSSRALGVISVVMTLVTMMSSRTRWTQAWVHPHATKQRKQRQLQQPFPLGRHSMVVWMDSSNESSEGNGSRAKELSLVHRYRGKVDQGYGRGGKKLGVPTANLPSSLFQNALETVDAGVYFGWATLELEEEDDTQPCDHSLVYKAVVNVGYSPTFEGQENKEKIIEAHLMTSSSFSSSSSSLPEDFYGIPMRLQLIGFLREEQKFDSFPELIAQIHADIKNAKEALDIDTPFRALQQDTFLNIVNNPNWIGESGGDENASWEFVPLQEALAHAQQQ